jgi:hypothetical protein
MIASPYFHWLDGSGFHYFSGREFNDDRIASRCLINSGAFVRPSQETSPAWAMPVSLFATIGLCLTDPSPRSNLERITETQSSTQNLQLPFQKTSKPNRFRSGARSQKLNGQIRSSRRDSGFRVEWFQSGFVLRLPWFISNVGCGEIAPALKISLDAALECESIHMRKKIETSELQRDNRSERRTKVFQFYDGGVIARPKVSVMYKCQRLKLRTLATGPSTIAETYQGFEY